MEEKKTAIIGAKAPEPLKFPEPKKGPATIPEVVGACMESVAATEDFLSMLKQVGSYNFRKTIHLSDVELSKLLDDNITAQLRVTRDYYIMWEFVHRDPKTAAKFGKFWDECNAEIQRYIAGEEE